jgi:hypothetical protein
VRFLLTIAQRTQITRLLCAVSMLSWTVASIALAIMAFLLAMDAGGSASAAMKACAISVGLGMATSALLALWRRCDRCGRPLFALTRGSSTSRPFDLRPRDYRARPFMGSFTTRAMIDAVFKGRACCMWCGQEDGKTLDYIVTTPK